MKLQRSIPLVAVLLFAGLISPAKAADWKLGVASISNPGGGLRIVQVFDHSPAQAVGLQPGHVIITVDGHFVDDPFLLRDYVFDGRTGIRIVYQHQHGFTEVDADFAVTSIFLTPPVAATYGVKNGHSAANALKGKSTESVLKLKSIRKRSVADPRTKLGSNPPPKSGLNSTTTLSSGKNVYSTSKSKSNPLRRH